MNFFKKHAPPMSYHDSLIGHTINESCPMCNSPLMGNAVGSKWCSKTDCSYFLHRGEVTTLGMITVMNNRTVGKPEHLDKKI
jgi:hypothetical protein